MFTRILAVVGLLIAVPTTVQARAPVPKPPKMDAKTIAAFETIGGVYGMIATGSDGYMTFDGSSQGIAKGGLPSFSIPIVKRGTTPPDLPPVTIPFGLVLIEAAGFTKAIAEMPNLTTIIFQGNVSNVDQFHELIHAKGLTSIRFQCGGAHDKTVKILAQLKGLSRLEIDRSNAVTASGWQHLSALKELTSFKTHFSHLGDTEMKIIGGWSKLESLRIQSYEITDKGILELAALKELEWLVLEGTKLTGAGLKSLRNSKRLRTLHITGTNITLPELRVLKEFTDLRDLGIGAVTDAGMRELAGLINLSALHLKGSRVTGKELHQFPALKTLDLADCPVTDEGLKIVGQLKSLTSLRLTHIRVSEAGMKSLSGLEQLKELSLAGTGMTDAGLLDIKIFADLERLNLGYTSVTDASMPIITSFRSLNHLELTSTKVSDRGIKELRTLKKLTYLSLAETTVTDAGFGELEKMPALHQVVPTFKITPRAVERLEKAVPGCTVGGYLPR